MRAADLLPVESVRDRLQDPGPVLPGPSRLCGEDRPPNGEAVRPSRGNLTTMGDGLEDSKRRLSAPLRFFARRDDGGRSIRPNGEVPVALNIPSFLDNAAVSVPGRGKCEEGINLPAR